MSTVTTSRPTGRPAGAAEQRRGGAGRVIAATLLVAALALGVIVWATPVLGLTTITVVGADSKPVDAAFAATVRSAAAVPVGTPLARIDVAAVRSRVVHAAPVASATVLRQWPHGLTITATERVAVATTEANGTWWLVDRTGKPFTAVASQPAGLMPLRLAAPGAGDRATMAALGVLGSLSAAIRAQVVVVSAPTAYDVTLVLKDGRSVVWGAAIDAAAKNLVVPAMLKRPGDTIDVSDPTLVTVRDNDS